MGLIKHGLGCVWGGGLVLGLGVFWALLLNCHCQKKSSFPVTIVQVVTEHFNKQQLEDEIVTIQLFTTTVKNGGNKFDRQARVVENGAVAP